MEEEIEQHERERIQTARAETETEAEEEELISHTHLICTIDTMVRLCYIMLIYCGLIVICMHAG